jgi:hypothetical protein
VAKQPYGWWAGLDVRRDLAVGIALLAAPDGCFRSRASARGTCPRACALDETRSPRPRPRSRLLRLGEAQVNRPDAGSADQISRRVLWHRPGPIGRCSVRAR